MKCFEEETKEDVGGKEHEGENDGAAHATPGADFLLAFFLFGFLFGAFFLRGGGMCAVIVAATDAGVAVGCLGLFHAGFGWRRCCVLGALGWGSDSIGLVIFCRDAGCRDGLVGLQQALRADDHAVIGYELLVADFQFFTAFWTSPAHK